MAARAKKAKRAPLKTCGSCSAGICLMNGTEVQRCDDCKLFESDQDAADAVGQLLALLHEEYQGRETSDTVADAFARLRITPKVRTGL